MDEAHASALIDIPDFIEIQDDVASLPVNRRECYSLAQPCGQVRYLLWGQALGGRNLCSRSPDGLAQRGGADQGLNPCANVSHSVFRPATFYFRPASFVSTAPQQKTTLSALNLAHVAVA